MRCDAELVVLGGDRRIMLVAGRPGRIVEQPVEIIRRQVERAGVDRQHLVAEGLHRAVIGQHLGLPARQQRLVRPMVDDVRGKARLCPRVVGRTLTQKADHLIEVGLGIFIYRR